MSGSESILPVDPFYEDEFVTIYHGDSRELLPLIDADVMVTDPPYGYAYASNRDKRIIDGPIANDHDTSARDDVLEVWGARPAIMFGSWKRPRPAATRMMLIWDKGGAVGMGDLSMPWKPSFEEIYVIGDGFHGRRNGGVLRYVVNASNKGGVNGDGWLHPNEKPIPLMRDLLGKCPPGVIVDPFMGSGSTLRAAKDLGRRAIGIEVDSKWCEVAVKRLAQEVLDVA